MATSTRNKATPRDWHATNETLWTQTRARQAQAQQTREAASAVAHATSRALSADKQHVDAQLEQRLGEIAAMTQRLHASKAACYAEIGRLLVAKDEVAAHIDHVAAVPTKTNEHNQALRDGRADADLVDDIVDKGEMGSSREGGREGKKTRVSTVVAGCHWHRRWHQPVRGGGGFSPQIAPPPLPAHAPINTPPLTTTKSPPPTALDAEAAALAAVAKKLEQTLGKTEAQLRELKGTVDDLDEDLLAKESANAVDRATSTIDVASRHLPRSNSGSSGLLDTTRRLSTAATLKPEDWYAGSEETIAKAAADCKASQALGTHIAEVLAQAAQTVRSQNQLVEEALAKRIKEVDHAREQHQREIDETRHELRQQDAAIAALEQAIKVGWDRTQNQTDRARENNPHHPTPTEQGEAAGADNCADGDASRAHRPRGGGGQRAPRPAAPGRGH